MFRKKLNSKGPQEDFKFEINMTPLVDVMLVLLVIFMVSAPMMTTGVQVSLPNGQTAVLDSSSKKTPLIVTIHPTKGLFFQDASLEQNDLAQRIKEVVGINPDVRIYVRADQSLSYGYVMTIMEIIAESGGKHVALLTDGQKIEASK